MFNSLIEYSWTVVVWTAKGLGQFGLNMSWVVVWELDVAWLLLVHRHVVQFYHHCVKLLVWILHIFIAIQIMQVELGNHDSWTLAALQNFSLCRPRLPIRCKAPLIFPRLTNRNIGAVFFINPTVLNLIASYFECRSIRDFKWILNLFSRCHILCF